MTQPSTHTYRAGGIALIAFLGLAACDDRSEGEWQHRISAPAGASATFVVDGEERLRIGCRTNPPSLFVDSDHRRDSAAPIILSVGDKRFDLETTITDHEGATRLTPEQVEALSAGAIQVDGERYPAISGPALKSLQTGCTKVLEGATPAGARWTFGQTSEGGVLAFALPDSDYPSPRFECPSRGVVRFVLPAVSARPRQIVATSGAGTADAEPAFEIDQLNGGEIWSIDLPVDHALLRGLERTGELRIVQPSPTKRFASSGAGPAVASFRAACSPAPL